MDFASNKYLKENQLKKTHELTTLLEINKEACKEISNLAEKYIYYTLKDNEFIQNYINTLKEYIKFHLHSCLQNSLEDYFEAYNLFN